MWSEEKKEKNGLGGTGCSESQILTACLYISTGKKREGLVCHMTLYLTPPILSMP